MIHIHMSGRLTRDPEEKTSKNGKSYTSALLVATAGDGDQLVTLMAFDTDLQALLAGLKKGDSLSVMGSASFRAYTDRDGNPAASVSLMANRIMALAEAKAKTKPSRESRSPPQERGYLESLATVAPPAEPEFVADDIPF